ncbi:Zn(II)2Cys6 transcription factor domain-containing protein, partial [Aspergillus ibericus CBS 121593]
MPLRRSHAKSHHGCAQCKQRRIKCNEARPMCSSCQKKQLNCSFTSHATLTSRLQLLDLELLNHWHVTTVQTLVHERSTEKVLREFVPQEALSHPFLMHSLLALSALHLSHHGPVERRPRYTEAAMTHNNISLSLCTPLLNNVTPGNCHALFAFACFVAMFSFAAHGPKVTPRAHSVSDVLEVFKLVRGVASIVAQARPWIKAGGMRDLLQVGRQPRQTSKTTHVGELHARIQKIYDQARSAEADDSTNSVVAIASQKLLDLLQLSTTVQNPASTIMRWPAVVDLKYLDLLLEDNASALVVLAHYGVALDMMMENWWMDGWGTFLVHLALDRLGPESGPEVAWAQKVINGDNA